MNYTFNPRLFQGDCSYPVCLYRWNNHQGNIAWLCLKWEKHKLWSWLKSALSDSELNLLERLQTLVERVLPESQCAFRSERSTMDMIFSLRQLQEKCREQQMPLYIILIDLTKAFDLVSRNGLFNILLKIGCPPRLHSLIRSFHDDMKATIQYQDSTSEPFDVKSRVKQGCVLAPTLFGIYFSMLLKHAFGTATEGVYLLGLHDILFQHRYRDVRIRNSHIAGCAMFSRSILFVIYILIVFFAHTQTLHLHQTRQLYRDIHF